MSLTDHHIDDTGLIPYLEHRANIDDNARVAALVRQQSDPEKGWPRLIKNLETYRRLEKKVVTVSGVDIAVTLNETRAPSVTAKTFENAKSGRKPQCFLCHLDSEQRGLLTLDNRYIILVNPGITIPGDLTIASAQHDPQIVRDSFGDMLILSRKLTDYSIFFNGAMAGASSPHFHFQAGLKSTLIAERQIERLLNKNPKPAHLVTIFKNQSSQICFVDHFLRAMYLLISRDDGEIKRFFEIFYKVLQNVDQAIRNIPNIPDFGSILTSLEINEYEPRMNLMLKFDPSSGQYLLAIFPKIINRPQAYFRRGDEQILVGMAIKESLGNLISCRRSDYQKLYQQPHLIEEIYRDTSITRKMVDDLNAQLMAAFSL